MIKRKEIVIETGQKKIVSKNFARYGTWCAECRAEVEFVTFKEALFIARSVQSFDYSVAAETTVLHSRATPEGIPLVCINSLLSH